MVRQAVSDYHISMLSLRDLLVKLFPEQGDFNISVCSSEEKADDLFADDCDREDTE